MGAVAPKTKPTTKPNLVGLNKLGLKLKSSSFKLSVNKNSQNFSHRHIRLAVSDLFQPQIQNLLK